jgi:hypothetical protein
MIGGTEGAKDGDNHPRKVLEALLKEASLLEHFGASADILARCLICRHV